MRGRKRCSTNVKIPFRGLVRQNRDVWERTPCRTGDQEYHMAGTRVPDSMTKLAWRQAIELRPRHFKSDARSLLKVLDETITRAHAPARPTD